MGTVSIVASIKAEDDKEEEKNFCHAISLELHVFHHNLPKIPAGCYCEW